MSYRGVLSCDIMYIGPLRVTSGAAIPTGAPADGDSWRVGDQVMNTATAAGGTPGWVCTTAGSPGTWKAMASVAA